MDNLTRRDVLKAAALIPFIGLGCREPDCLTGCNPTPEGPLGWYCIRPEHRNDPSLPFAIKYLEQIQMRLSKGVELEYYFYEKKSGWCIKFHNFENRVNITENPTNILESHFLDVNSSPKRLCDSVKFEGGMIMPLFNESHGDWFRPEFNHYVAKNKNVIIVEYANQANGLTTQRLNQC